MKTISKIEEEITKLVNDFILEIEPALFSHLIDTDENPAQRLRDNLFTLLSASHKELIERVRKEVIGSDEEQQIPRSNRSIMAYRRNQLRAEQRNLLSTIEKD